MANETIKSVRLGDVFDLQMGKTPARADSSFWGGGHKWISIADIGKADVYISETKETISDAAISASGIRPIPKDTLIMSFKLSIGKVAITAEEMFSNEAIMSFRDLGKHELDLHYLFHQFKNKDWSGGMNKAVMGATLNKASLKCHEILLHPLAEQKRIAAALDKISEMKRNAEARLQKLDLLVKSRFNEMFECANGKGWPVVRVGELLARPMANGFFAKRDAYCVDGNVSVLGVVNVVNTMYCRVEDLPRTNATSVDIEKYGLHWGDMLFCRSSLVKEGIGKASIVSRCVEPSVLFECHVIRASLDMTRIEPVFAQVQSTRPYFRAQIIAQSKTATMTTIGQSGIACAKMILPPLSLQRSFAAFVEKVEALKATAQKELEKVDLLYRAKLQEYFG